MTKNMTEEQLEAGEIKVSAKPSDTAQGANEFGDEYTLEVISDNEPGSDIFRIPHKDPKFEYRFLREDKANMNIKTSNLLMLKGGWQICPIKHLERIGIDKKFLHPDGSFRVGELILAFMPKELFAKKMKEDRRKTDEAMAGVKRLVEQGDQVLVHIKDVKGIVPGRMDGGRIVFDKQAKGSVKVKRETYGSHNEVNN